MKAYRFEAPEIPQALDRPPDTADDVDDSSEGVLVKCFDGGDEACVSPVIDNRQGGRDGGPDAEGRVDCEGEEEPGVRQRPVIS